MPKPVRLREVAANDIEAALTHYLDDASGDVATRFIAAVQHCLARVARNPHSGSLRFAYDLELPELRCRSLERFPYLIFYIERQRTIDVWRVLHDRRDIPATLRDLDDG